MGEMSEEEFKDFQCDVCSSLASALKAFPGKADVSFLAYLQLDF